MVGRQLNGGLGRWAGIENSYTADSRRSRFLEGEILPHFAMRRKQNWPLIRE
jgi:hypothetical protein